MSKVKQDIVRELHKPARKNFKRRRIIIKGLDDLWQADLADFKLYARDNRGYKYILVIIDSFSKYLWTVALKSKTATEVRDAMEKLLKTSSRLPKNLQTDAGSEFFNKLFQALMKKYHINHYSTFSVIKASIAERVVRTLKEKLYKEFSLRGKFNWLSILDNVTNEYNTTKHHTIGRKPKDVTKRNEKVLLQSVYNHPKIAGKRKFSINDMVRISKYKSIFDKGYTPNWSTELFKVVKVQLTNPTTYLLEDTNSRPILGAFYEQELQRVKHKDAYLVEKVIRRKGSNMLVSWLGLPHSENSWVKKTNIL